MKMKVLALVFLVAFAALGTFVAFGVSGASVATVHYKPMEPWRTVLAGNGASIRLLGDPINTPGMPT